MPLENRADIAGFLDNPPHFGGVLDTVRVVFVMKILMGEDECRDFPRFFEIAFQPFLLMRRDVGFLLVEVACVVIGAVPVEICIEHNEVVSAAVKRIEGIGRPAEPQKLFL